MTDTQLLTIAASLVATLFGLLVMLLGWMGNRLYAKLESISEIFSELRDDIAKMDKRLTIVEERFRYEHEMRQQ